LHTPQSAKPTLLETNHSASPTTSSFHFRQKSDQNLDQQYAVNAVANAILIERLSKSAKVARFVLVSSEAHRWAKPSEIDATLHGLMNPPPYTTTNAFDQYSRYAMLSTIRMRPCCSRLLVEASFSL
jgi:hypothetical protein